MCYAALSQEGSIMSYRNELPEGTGDRLECLLKGTKEAEVLRRIQAIYLRARHGFLPEQIAQITGYSVGTVHNLHSRYLKEGDRVFVLGRPGGRNAAHMTPDEERAFLEPFVESGDAGGILEVGPIHKAHCERLGKAIALSTTYRLLHRQGWRKIQPRPRHPKADREARASFKKTGRDA